LPGALRPWLLDKGSLTERLIRASQGRFGVRVLRQQVTRPRLDEINALGIHHGRGALVREVLLLGNGTPWVYARSILPLTTLTGRLRSLKQLDDRPLGARLFADPSMHRGVMEIARIPAASLPANLASTASALWGRRSLFFLDQKPLLVSEIFLPGFTPYNVAAYADKSTV
jgi:chorismate lyase